MTFSKTNKACSCSSFFSIILFFLNPACMCGVKSKLTRPTRKSFCTNQSATRRVNYLKLLSLVVSQGLKIGQTVSQHGQCGLHGLVPLCIRHFHDLSATLTNHRHVFLDWLQLWQGFLSKTKHFLQLVVFIVFRWQLLFQSPKSNRSLT